LKIRFFGQFQGVDQLDPTVRFLLGVLVRLLILSVGLYLYVAGGRAPQLLDKNEMVTDDPVGESFWKVKNGIRLLGMPSLKNSLSKTQIWQVSALLARADQLPPEVSAKLKARADRIVDVGSILVLQAIQGGDEPVLFGV
jgi:hypothetical protein